MRCAQLSTRARVAPLHGGLDDRRGASLHGARPSNEVVVVGFIRAADDDEGLEEGHDELGLIL